MILNMAASNHTPNPNCHLPQWVDDDKPSWLGDMNGAMSAIDAELTRLQGLINDQATQIVALQNGKQDKVTP